jgi:hypothetical protein
VYRLYREMGLQLRHKMPKRRVKAKLREDRRPATRSDDTWAMDFVHDQLAIGTKLQVLTIIDALSRVSPVAVRVYGDIRCGYASASVRDGFALIAFQVWPDAK